MFLHSCHLDWQSEHGAAAVVFDTRNSSPHPQLVTFSNLNLSVSQAEKPINKRDFAVIKRHW